MKKNDFQPLQRGHSLLLLFFLALPALSPAQVANLSGVDSTIFISHTVFLPAYSFEAGDQNWSTAVADINRDGFPDVISASKTDSKVHVNYNDGKGNFGIRQAFTTPPQNRAVCVIDANEDGATDVTTVTLLGKLCILLNDGKGNLSRTLVISTGVMAHDVAAEDVNQDGHKDLLVASVSGNSIYVHYGDGKAKFGAAVVIPTGDKPRSVRAGDLNGDQLPDLVTGCDDGRVYYHLNQGNGKFQSPQSLRSGAANWGLELADLNNDQKLDIATASYMDKKLCIHLNRGDATFLREQEIISGDHNFDLVIRDFDLDGDPDIVTCSTVDHAISFHLNDGQGVFGERIEMKSGNWNAGIDAADFDGDGDADIVTASINDHNINVHRNISAEKIARENVKETFIHGTIRDKDTREPLPGADISLRNYLGEFILGIKADEKGYYRQSLPFDTGYEAGATYPRYRDEFRYFDLSEDHFPNGLRVDIDLETRVPPQHICLSGTVFDAKTRVPIPFAGIVIRNMDGNRVKKFRVDAAGNYEVCLPYGSYKFSALAKGYFFNVSQITLQQSDPELGKTHDIYLLPLEAEAMIVLENIYYDVDKATLRPESVEELDRVLEIMQQNPSLKVEISGHTDSDASDEYNRVLSDNRAKSVVDYLFAAGIDISRLIAKGYGEQSPVVPNDTPENKQLNRRTEFKVVSIDMTTHN
ncbi:MAG: FG-GAP-like repeat-containing protein [Bacteroidia bacterium]|nr:FG-GAP-like repeat-containing protein [Bacteroidia bacterium]